MSELLLIAIKAAIEAGLEIMNIYSGAFEVVLKPDASPLTVADEHANTIINTYLKTTGIPVISEENKQTPYHIRQHWDTCWMVDPLDGTKEFIKRNGEFTVNIALIKNNQPVLGVIYVPASKTLYYALVSDMKAYRITLATHEFTEAIFTISQEIVPKRQESDSVNIVGSRSHKSMETDAFIKHLEAQGKQVAILSKGSSLKFCMVAEGQATLYPRFAPTMEWDTAAGHAICNAVGLKVMQAGKQEELQYNKEQLLNPYFIVA